MVLWDYAVPTRQRSVIEGASELSSCGGGEARRNLRLGGVRVEPTFGWVSLAPKALARARAQMEQGSQGVRDELGFLLLHQRYADRFFPGTSVLHTRLRYALFVPWMFCDQAGKPAAQAQHALTSAEVALARRLTDAGETGVIGKLALPNPADQPPSVVYWSALEAWGILRRDARGRAPSRRLVHGRLEAASRAADDDGEPILGFDPPFTTLPPRPPEWVSGGPLNFALSAGEKAFIQERLGQVLAPDSARPSLLARLARDGVKPPKSLWSETILRRAGPDEAPLGRAQAVAAIAAIGRGVYAALVEHLREQLDGRETPRIHRDHLPALVSEHATVALTLDAAEFPLVPEDVGPLPPKLSVLMSATLAWLEAGAKNPVELLDTFAAAEARKGPRARLAMTVDGRSRRTEWDAAEHPLGSPLHYRWPWVARLLQDLRARPT